MKKLILIAGFLIICNLLQAQQIQFVRVCNGGNDNKLSWRLSANPCTLISPITIYGRDLSTIPFFIIDATSNGAAGSYTHSNANVPSTKNWQYFISYKLLCGVDTFNFHTDTLIVDDIKPDSTVLDSVSVDPITGVVYLGWSSNKTPDFSSYYLYNYDKADPRLIENYRDTFYTDLNPIDPGTKSLSYDITSSDSCDNRKDYGNYKHQTICLKGSIDTCANQASITWNAYVGWSVLQYEVYKKINTGTYQYLTTLPSNVLSYKDNNVGNGNSYQYFVRARKSNPGVLASSSSNSTKALVAGLSTNPSGTEILFVSNNNSNNLELQIKRNSSSNYSTIDLFRTRLNSSPVMLHTFTGTDDYFEDLSAVNTSAYKYFVVSKNVCGIISDSSKSSNNIVLEITQNTTDLSLHWLKYFTWNAGVKNYVIYRASGNTVAEAINFVVLGVPQTDTNYSEPIPEPAVNCYYVIAEENLGSNKSRSNTVCHIKTGNIYYPNALTIFGTNKVFTFLGEGIDLGKSSIQIYNRWGAIEYNKEDISAGWDGKNNSGEVVPADVYFFTAQISQGNTIVNIHGNITVLK